MVPGSIPPRAWLAVLALACGASACRSDVQFYEKAALSDPVMDMAERPLETHWHAKLFFSLEGSIGGFGTSGGGGCGCY
jgi:hypothetical protein